MRTNYYLLAIVMIGLLLRVWQLGAVPLSLYWDEAAIGYDAYMISQTGKTMHGNPWYSPIYLSYGDYKAPVYIILSSFFVRLIGTSILSVRLASALLGTGTIYIMYLIGKALYSKRVGLLTGLVVSLSPWAIQFSRAGFEGNVALFFVACGVYFWLMGRKRPLALAVSAVMGLIGVYSYFSVRVVYPLLLLAITLVFWKEYLSRWRMVVMSVTIFGLGLLPIIASPYYEASNTFRLSTPSVLNTNDHILNSNAAREMHGFSLFSRLVYHRYVLQAQRLMSNIFDHLSPAYLFFIGDSNLRHGTGEVGLFVWPWIICLGVFIYQPKILFSNKGMLLLMLWLMALIPASIPLETPHALRSLNALIPLSIILALGLDVLLRMRRWVVLCMGVLVCLTTIGYLHDYYAHYPVRSSSAWQYGYIHLAKALDHYDESYETVYVEDLDRFYLYYLFFTGKKTTDSSDTQMLAWQPTHIDGIHFSLPSPTEHLSRSTLVVLSDETYQKTATTWQVIDTILISDIPMYYLVEPLDEAKIN